MIRINLLPHREEARKAKRQQFYAMAGAAVAFAALVVFLGYTIINGYISGQADANDFLKRVGYSNPIAGRNHHKTGQGSVG